MKAFFSVLKSMFADIKEFFSLLNPFKKKKHFDSTHEEHLKLHQEALKTLYNTAQKKEFNKVLLISTPSPKKKKTKKKAKKVTKKKVRK